MTAWRGVEARLADEVLGHRLRGGAAAVAARVAVILAAGLDVAQEARGGVSEMRSGTTSPWAIAEPSPQVALSSICPSAVSLKPPPEALAETSGWISTAIAVSAGLSPWFSM